MSFINDHILTLVTFVPLVGSLALWTVIRRDGIARVFALAVALIDFVLSLHLWFRFDAGRGLKGHSFGNLFLTALSKVTGDFQQAIREANRILNVRGKVLPASPCKLAVIAHHADG